jgi:hypothetical protein
MLGKARDSVCFLVDRTIALLAVVVLPVVGASAIDGMISLVTAGVVFSLATVTVCLAALVVRRRGHDILDTLVAR